MKLHLLLFFVLFLSACSVNNPEPIDGKVNDQAEVNMDGSEESSDGNAEGTVEQGSMGPQESSETGCQTPGDNVDLYFYTSSDGNTFSEGEKIYSLVSVPHLFYEQALDEYLLSFQIFEEAPLCGVMAYTQLSSEGEILDPVQRLNIDSEYYNGFDPTFVSVEDTMVLSYTVRPQGLKSACISLAYGDDVSSLVGLDSFLWCSPDDSETYMDSSALYLAPYLYVYVPSDAAMSSGRVVSYYIKVDASASDPTEWEIVDEGMIEGLDMFLLGEITSTDEDACPYRFYGTYMGKIQSACTEDGVTFTLASEDILSGADPGVAQDADGNYMMVVVQN